MMVVFLKIVALLGIFGLVILYAAAIEKATRPRL